MALWGIVLVWYGIVVMWCGIVVVLCWYGIVVLWYCADVVWHCGGMVLWWVTLCWGMIMLLLSGQLLPAGDGHQMAKFSFWDLLQLPHIINGW